jgi:hypothetical protein
MKINDDLILNYANEGAKKQNENLVDMDSLIGRVKAEDAKNLRMTKSFLWTYIILAVIYTGLIIINPDPDITIIKRISGACYIASMIIFALVFRGGHKEFKSIDYSLPVIDMLRKAAKRYELKSKKLLILSVPILLMDIGLTLSFYEDLLPMTPLNRVLIIQVFYIPLMTISGVIGYFVWRNKQKPLRDNALKLIDELEKG